MTKNEKVVVDPKNYEGFIQTILYDGVCPYTKKTEQDYIVEGFSIVTWEEFEPIQENYLNSLCNQWKEITEEQFEDALNVLPPMRWGNGGFFMSERYTDDVTGYYQQINNRYFTSYQRLSYKRQDILNNLYSFIKEAITA